MTGRKSPVTRRKILRWLGALILLVVGGFLAWHWFLRPPEFILVTRIARAHPTEGEEWVPGGLLQKNIPDSKRTPCVMTLTGWDGRQRWRITSPVATLPERPGDHPSWNERTIAVSPDGRTVALLFTDGPYIRVYGWRDGELSSSANLPRLPGKPAILPLYHFTATNDGFLWVSTPELRTCRIWRINGKQVASGSYLVLFTMKAGQELLNQLSPDGSVLLCWESLPYLNPRFSPNGQFHYIAVEVKGAQIVFDHRYTINEPSLFPRGNGIFFVGNTFYGPNGRISPNSLQQRNASPILPLEAGVSYGERVSPAKGINLRRTTEIVVSGSSQPGWVIPNSQRSQVFSPNYGFFSTSPGACTPDGRYALVFLPAAPLQPEGVFAQLKRVPVLRTRLLYREKLVSLSLYERPGKLLAQLPLSQNVGVYHTGYYSLQDTPCEIRRWALSPDGRHVGLSLYRSDTEFEYRLYRVK